jgi:hypothetical protein
VRCLYIDPGKVQAGAALFYEKNLEDVCLLKGSVGELDVACRAVSETAKRWLAGREVDRLICERPSFWRQGGGRGNPNDILDLMATNGSLFAAIPAKMRLYAPVTQWKKQVPKDVMAKRIFARLSAEELSLLGEKPDHNVLDAVGIGLWDLKRV